MGFLNTAMNRRVNAREFLRSAVGGNSIKYKGGKGEKHQLLLTYRVIEEDDENGQPVFKKELNAIMGKVHDIRDGKNFSSCLCLEGEYRQDENGNELNDGTCPFCDSVSKGWDIYKYRKELEQNTCGKTGQALDDHMKAQASVFNQQRKVSEAKFYMYMLFAQFRLDPNKNFAPILSPNGLPEYELKVMRMSSSAIDKLQKQLDNSGVDMEGAEIIIEYPNEEDVKKVYLDRSIAVAFNKKSIVNSYPEVIDAINQDVENFQWETIESAFSEWKGMTVSAARNKCDELFEVWDTYQEELKTNPNAKYLEYVGVKNDGNNPKLGNSTTAEEKTFSETFSQETDNFTVPDVNDLFGARP